MTGYQCKECGEFVHQSRKFCGKCGALNDEFVEETDEFSQQDLGVAPETFFELDKYVWYVQNREPSIPVPPQMLDQLLRDFINGNEKVAEHAKQALIEYRPRGAAMPLIQAAKSTRIFNDKSQDALTILAAIGDPEVIPHLIREEYSGDKLMSMLIIVGVCKDPPAIDWLGKHTKDKVYGALAIKLLGANSNSLAIDSLIMNADGFYYDIVDEAIGFRTETFLGSLAKYTVNAVNEQEQKKVKALQGISMMFLPFNPLFLFDALDSNLAVTFCKERLRLNLLAEKISKTPSYPFRNNLSLGLPEDKAVRFLLIALAMYLGMDVPYLESELILLTKNKTHEPPEDIGIYLINDGIMRSRSKQMQQKYGWFPEHFVSKGDVLSMTATSTQAVVYNYQPLANGVLKNPNQLVDVPGVGYAAFFNKNPMALAICENYQKRDKERLKVWYESYSDWINST